LSTSGRLVVDLLYADRISAESPWAAISEHPASKLTRCRLEPEIQHHNPSEMIPLRDRNPTTTVPIVNFVLIGLNLAAFVLFIIPAARRHWLTLNLGCLATYAGVYIEKGMGLIIPGLTPDTLGEIYEYYPTGTELRIAAGIFAIGFLVFTLMLKVAVPISLGEFRVDRDARQETLEGLWKQAGTRGPHG